MRPQFRRTDDFCVSYDAAVQAFLKGTPIQMSGSLSVVERTKTHYEHYTRNHTAVLAAS
jgi:hypothetical protein